MINMTVQREKSTPSLQNTQLVEKLIILGEKETRLNEEIVQRTWKYSDLNDMAGVLLSNCGKFNLDKDLDSALEDHDRLTSLAFRYQNRARESLEMISTLKSSLAEVQQEIDGIRIQIKQQEDSTPGPTTVNDGGVTPSAYATIPAVNGGAILHHHNAQLEAERLSKQAKMRQAALEAERVANEANCSLAFA